MTRRRVLAAVVLLAVVAAVVGWVVWPRPASYRTEDRMLTISSGPDGATPVTLDTTFYLPKGASSARPVPAVLLAHGFGGTKASVIDDAKDLADRGYAVLTWTARGFGRSGGEIHLDSPDYEVRDAQRLLDWLADRPEVRRDAPGDPRVGVVGGSYGGGLALLLAGYDRRVDAVVPMITWNDLARSFLPESTGGDPVDGVFKKDWAGLFFGRSLSNQGPFSRDAADPACGRFAKPVCDAYLSIATTGRAAPAAVELLRRSSPASVLDRITAPTLLIQGESDTLFPLAEADATARGLAAHGTPVRVAWFTGGHDTGAGPPSDQDRVRFLTAQWLDQLKGDPAPSRSFTFSRISGIDAVNRETVATGYSVADYPGLAGQRTTAVPVAGPPQRVANPPNGTPSAVSSVPQVSQLANLVGGAGVAGALSGEIPGQYAGFVSAPLPSSVDIVGAATVQIKAASPTGEAVLFVKLREISPDGQTALVEGAMAPVRLRGLPASIDAARPVTVTLPAVVHRLEAGQRVWLTISTADQAYAGPPAPTTYTVAVAGPLTLPEVTASPIPNPNLVWRWVLVALVGALVLGLVAVLIATRRRRPGVEADSDVPLVVSGLRKVYGDGFVAVSKVDFTVHRGQVVGLLGPNGAGKTTALRVLLGLIRPTAGEILVFGQRLVPGAPVLARVGALVEGPGFLPHLSGLANLTTFWRATGRPADQSRLAEVLDIAGLGDDIHRKVRTYSHGMKQRLAIAQAMLGMPELLVLDEPTDGLDPPQIAEMRRVLQRYATDGRAVLVSSHLLAEVEQTCTDVVVVHRGEIVASGPVADIVGESPTVHLAVSDVDAAATVLDGLDGIRSVQRDGPGGLTVDIDGRPRAAVVEALVQAGIGVDRVVPRRRLEDAFLALVREGASDEPAH